MMRRMLLPAVLTTLLASCAPSADGGLAGIPVDTAPESPAAALPSIPDYDEVRVLLALGALMSGTVEEALSRGVVTNDDVAKAVFFLENPDLGSVLPEWQE